MKFDSKKHHRRSIRLQGYDYSQSGAYFITICTHNKKCTLGKIVDDKMILNVYGKIVQEEWVKTAQIRKGIKISSHVVMPNHLHGIIFIDVGEGTLQCALTREQFGKTKSNSIPTIVRLFKSTVTKQINVLCSTPQKLFWQRNYYEHVIRDDEDLSRIHDYIIYNPENWEKDRNYMPNV